MPVAEIPSKKPPKVPSAALPDIDFSFLDKGLIKPQGRPLEIRIPVQAQIAGVLAGTLAEIKSKHPAVKEYLYSLMGQGGRMEALHREHSDNGLALVVSKNSEIPLALRVETWIPAQEAQASFYPHHLIVLEPHTKATLVEELRGPGAASVLHNSVTEIILQEGAELDYVIFQDLARSTRSFSFEFARLARNAKLHLVHVELGAGTRRIELNVDAAGEGSQAVLDGVYYGEDSQSLETAIHFNHLAGNTESDIHWKSAVAGRARSHYLGQVYIASGADKSRAYQATNNLLLSKEAKVAPDPRLEILADDVIAKHAATVSYLDEEARFYLRSRGVAGNQAERMLALAFFTDALKRLRPEIHQEAVVRLEAALEGKKSMVSGVEP